MNDTHPTSPSRHVAIDLGASGGRVALGEIEAGRLRVSVVHRFRNPAVPLPSGLYWDVLGLWREVLHGLRLASEEGFIASVGVNSWGVDYALLDDSGLLMDGVHHYRDARTESVTQGVFDLVPRQAIYASTGIQFMPLNTIFQLVAHARQAPGILQRARTLLMLPDLFHYWLSGRMVAERTIASTSQLYDPRKRTWSDDLMQACGIPRRLFQQIVDPGTLLGEARPDLGMPGTQVVAPGSHDTASAVAAVPASGTDWAYVSSGTWSLVGIETREPLIDDATLQGNLTNETGVEGTIRLLKNVVGLWILQECRRAWGDPPYEDLYREAAALPAGGGLIDPDDPAFMPPGEDMPERVAKHMQRARGESRAAITRCILDSLAAKCGAVLDEIERVSGRRIETVHIVGGGSQIDFLNQLTANASRRRVVAGPVEATLMGNLLTQAQAMGSIPRGSVREVARASSHLKAFEPA